MKTAFILFFALMLLALNAKASNQPMSIKGQAEILKGKVTNLQLPNNQATLVAPQTYLLENGNTDLLANGSFEHETFNTGWTLAAGTGSEETTIVIDGKKSYKVVLAAEALSLYNDSTLYESQLAGAKIQGNAIGSIYKTFSEDLYICPRPAGVSITSDYASQCETITETNVWVQRNIPYTPVGTSNGIEFKTAGAVAGTVYADGAKSELGNITVGGTPVTSESFLRSTATVGSGNYLRFTGTILKNSLGNCLSYVESSGGDSFVALRNCTVNFSYGLQNTNALNTTETIFLEKNGVTIDRAYSQAQSGTSQEGNHVRLAGSYELVKNDVLKVLVSGPTHFNVTTSYVSILALAIDNNLTYSTNNRDTAWTSYTPTIGLTNGTTTAKWRRKGSMLEVTGSTLFAGAATGSSFQIGLPNGYVIDTNKLPTVTAELAVGVAGGVDSGVNRVGGYVAYYSTTNVIIMAKIATTYQWSAVQPASPFTIAANDTWTFKFSVPIVGWEDSDIMVGSFDGLESCEDTYECTDSFSADVSSTGVVSGEKIEWITGNAVVTGTSDFALTYKSGLVTQPMNCTTSLATNASAGIAVINKATSTSTGVVVRTATSASGTLSPIAFYIHCDKQGADYIGKTAKAVASDQNTRSIGSIGTDIQSVYFGSGATCNANCTTGVCNICHQTGTKITSVTWVSTGAYNLNGIDGTKYECVGATFDAANAVALFHNRTVSTASLARIGTTGSTNAGYASAICFGIP